MGLWHEKRSKTIQESKGDQWEESDKEREQRENVLSVQQYTIQTWMKMSLCNTLPCTMNIHNEKYFKQK